MYHHRAYSLILLSVFTHQLSANLVYEYDKRSDTAVAGTGFDANTTVLGDYHNYWTKYANGAFDLTRSARAGVTHLQVLPMAGSRKEIIIEPTRSALVIIDMQNFFLHPEL